LPKKDNIPFEESTNGKEYQNMIYDFSF